MAHKQVLLLALLLALLQPGVWALENGVARTPPMGWLSWERFRCNTDCENFPESCISDHLIRVMADRMVADGYLDLGYEYVIIDDCWLSRERDENDRLQADPDRFPEGIPALADYVHSKGLKFGIYEDYGNFTCAGYPGVLGHLKEDAETLASWGVDYIKLDGCSGDPATMSEGYPEFGQYLLASNRSILYLCQWPMYQEYAGITPDYGAVAENCNSWRIWNDVEDSWDSVASIIDYCAEKQDTIAQHAGPGHWNDPDMLVIGNFGLSFEQSKVQMALWSILAAPLIMSNDLRDISPEMVAILQNYEAIQVNQDDLGIQGRRVFKDNEDEVWTRPINPIVNEKNSWAVAVVNRGIGGGPRPITVDLPTVGLDNSDRFIFTELFGAMEAFEVDGTGSINVQVPPTGVLFFKAQVKQNITQD